MSAREQLAVVAYERRRLVHTLTAGAPHHGGAVVGGIALVLALAGVVVGRSLFASGAAAPTSWRACTADAAGIAFTVTGSPALRSTSDGGAVVASGGATWVLAADQSGHATRYRLPTSATGDRLLADIGLPPAAQATRVPPGWLTLLPDGGTLGPATWVRAHWSAPTLRPLAGTLCTELVPGGSSYVRLGTLPRDTAWNPPAPGEVTRSESPVPNAPGAWLALLADRAAGG